MRTRCQERRIKRRSLIDIRNIRGRTTRTAAVRPGLSTVITITIPHNRATSMITLTIPLVSNSCRELMSLVMRTRIDPADRSSKNRRDSRWMWLKSSLLGAKMTDCPNWVIQRSRRELASQLSRYMPEMIPTKAARSGPSLFIRAWSMARLMV